MLTLTFPEQQDADDAGGNVISFAGIFVKIIFGVDIDTNTPLHFITVLFVFCPCFVFS